MKAVITIIFLITVLPIAVFAQQPANCMPGMRMPGCPDPPGGAVTTAVNMGTTGLMSMPDMPPQRFVEEIARHTTSGTTAEPNSTPAPMLMAKKGPWMIMFHANVFIVDVQ